jgi:hypothetical protein
MPTRMKILKALLLGLAVQFVPVNSEACKCRGMKPPAEVLFSSYTLVFIGHATSANLIQRKNGDYSQFTFVPAAILKGDKRMKKIRMNSYGSSCDMNYQLGLHYLIYANRAGTDAYYAGVCDFSRHIGIYDLEDEIEKYQNIVKTLERKK